MQAPTSPWRSNRGPVHDGRSSPDNVASIAEVHRGDVFPFPGQAARSENAAFASSDDVPQPIRSPIVKTVTGSDGSGHFVVKDSSYTINQDEKLQQWDNGVDLANLLEANHDARGFGFQTNDTGSVSREYLQAGRVSNGTYYNYSTSTSRHTESAIVLAGAADREFKDPIIYPTHPSVSSYKTDAMQKGEEWDYRNTTLLFQTLPSWIQEEENLLHSSTYHSLPYKLSPVKRNIDLIQV